MQQKRTSEILLLECTKFFVSLTLLCKVKIQDQSLIKKFCSEVQRPDRMTKTAWHTWKYHHLRAVLSVFAFLSQNSDFSLRQNSDFSLRLVVDCTNGLQMKIRCFVYISINGTICFIRKNNKIIESFDLKIPNPNSCAATLSTLYLAL